MAVNNWLRLIKIKITECENPRLTRNRKKNGCPYINFNIVLTNII